MGGILNNKGHGLLVMLLLGMVFTGCESGPSVDDMVAQATDSNIKRVAKMYSICMKSNRWKGPEDASSLQAFIQRQNQDQLRAMGIDPDNLSALFLSEIDQQPFKIRWGLQSSMLSPPLPIVFEANPSPEGVYQVGFSGSTVKEVKQAEYDRLWEGDGDDVGPDPSKRR